MKLKLDKKEFLNALQLGGSFAGKNKHVAILDHVKISFCNGMKIASSDGENQIVTSCYTMSADDTFDFCVPYNQLVSYVKLINAPEFEITCDISEGLTIKHKKGKYTMPISGIETFPVIHLNDCESSHAEIKSDVLAEYISIGRNFAGTDELRPVTSGIYLYKRDGMFGCAATDTHSLYHNESEYTGESEDFEFILNPKAFNSVINLCNSYETVKITVTGKFTAIKGEETSVIIRNIEGRFPNFKAVLPKNQPIEAVFNKTEMLDSLSRVSLGASQVSGLIKLKLDSIEAVIEATDIDFSIASSETVKCELNSMKGLEIGFKSAFLKKVFSSINSESVKCHFTDASRASVITSAENNEKSIFLLMPMSLN